ncbi:outer membrane beta-barrel protein [Vibrio coralliilyticus]|nr:outer membrane beta-barrel protein [Vibrio coralliilyticus]
MVSPALASEVPEPVNLFFFQVETGAQLIHDNSYSDSDPTSEFYTVGVGSRVNDDWSLSFLYQDNGKVQSKTGVELTSLVLKTLAERSYHLNETTKIFGGFGASYWKLNKQFSNETYNAEGISPTANAGFEYNVSHHTRLRVNYEYTHQIGDSNTGSYDNHSLVFGVRYMFPNEHAKSNNRFSDPLESSVDTRMSDNNMKHVCENYLFSFNFDFDDTHFSSLNDHDDEMISVVTRLKQSPDSKIVLKGYADPIGKYSYNLRLSVRRAENVANYLMSNGISASKIVVLGLGERSLHQSSGQRNSSGRVVDVYLVNDGKSYFETEY